MTVDVSTNDHSTNDTVQSMWSPETEDNDRCVIYDGMDKTTLSRTPPYRAHSCLQPCSYAGGKHNRRDSEPKKGYNPALRGPPGGLQNARSDNSADQAPGGPIVIQPSAWETLWTAASVRMAAASLGMCTH